MIAVDTSALVAILLREPEFGAVSAVLEREPRLIISAGTLAEAFIVAARRGISEEMGELIAALDCEVAPVTQAAARRVGEAYARWGKGIHPAALNFGDCFAYDLARENGCPLLYVGNDFAKTDVTSAL